ncbi:hypothetical protein [Mycolicibacter minnesotensis]
METIRFNLGGLSGIAAAAVLAVAGLTPVVAASPSNPLAIAPVSTEIALASNAVVDGLDGLIDIAAFDGLGAVEEFDLSGLDVPGTAAAFDLSEIDAPGSAAAFDIMGLINAEFAAVQNMFGVVFSLPGSVMYHLQSMFDNLMTFDLGMAFSDLASIPQAVVNYLIGVPVGIGNILYEMVAVIPGEFLLNFSS